MPFVRRGGETHVTTLAVDPLEQFEAVVAGDLSVNRHAVYAQLRERHPIFFSPRLQAWVLTRYDDVKFVLEDEDAFYHLSEGPGAPVFGRSLLQWRGREHNKKAGPVVKRIRSPRSFKEGLEEIVRTTTVEMADKLPMDETIDLKQSYTMWMPLLVITGILDIHEAGAFRDWYHTMAQGGVSSISNPGAKEAALKARQEIHDMLEPIVEARRKDPGEDLVSDLAVAKYDGEQFPFDEIVSTVAFLLTAGVETTERVLASLFRHMALHPDEWTAIRARRQDENFLMSLSAEALRYYPPVHGLTRGVAEASTFHDVTVPKDDRLMLSLASANRDEHHFERAQEFDPERWLGNAERQFVAGGKILPFGSGRHHCAGSRLAGVEMVHGIRELAERVSVIEPSGEMPEAEGFVLVSPNYLPVTLRAA
jgi:pulcherriminic acid synthase